MTAPSASELHASANVDDAMIGTFCREIDRWLKAEVDPLAIDRAGALPAHLVRELAGMGVFGATLPEAHGGAGLGLVAGCRVTETLARSDRAIATTVGLHLGLGTRGLVAFGTSEQQAEWLPALAEGRHIAAFAATEPRAGSDLSRFSTHLRVSQQGRLCLDGHKIYVTNGGLASVFTVVAATRGLGGGDAGSALVIVQRGDHGFMVGPEERKLGLRGSSTTTLHFDGVCLPATRIIGDRPGLGHDHLAHVLGWGRTLMASGCCGTAADALDRTLAHVGSRHQFGRPLGGQPVVREQVATMAALLFAMRAIVRHTASGSIEGPSGERTSFAAKIFASENNWHICDRALQLHGGSGFIEDTGIALPLRDARVTRIFEGANDVLLTRLGALELTNPAAPLPRISPETNRIAAAVDDEITDLKRRGGLAALRDSHGLHRLGRLVTIREVAHAIIANPDPRYRGPLATVLAERATAALAADADAIRVAPHRIGEADAVYDILEAGDMP